MIWGSEMPDLEFDRYDLLRRYDAVQHHWKRYIDKETDMPQVNVKAPDNPYRPKLRSGGSFFETSGTYVPRSTDPGFSAVDIDRLMREQYDAGAAMAEQAAREREYGFEGEKAEAFDEGYVAGRVERARGLATDIGADASDIRAALDAALAGPKTKLPAALESVAAGLDQLRQRCRDIATDEVEGIAATDGVEYEVDR